MEEWKKNRRKTIYGIAILAGIVVVIGITAMRSEDESRTASLWAVALFMVFSFLTGRFTVKELRAAQARKQFYARAVKARVCDYKHTRSGYDFPTLSFRYEGETIEIESNISASQSKVPIGSSVTLRYHRPLRDSSDIFIPAFEPPAVTAGIAAVSIITLALAVAILTAIF